MPARVKSPDLPSFTDGKYDLDSYYCGLRDIPPSQSGRKKFELLSLALCCQGKRWMSIVYLRLSQEDVLDFVRNVQR